MKLRTLSGHARTALLRIAEHGVQPKHPLTGFNLEKHGLVVRRLVQENPPTFAFDVTAKGLEFLGK